MRTDRGTSGGYRNSGERCESRTAATARSTGSLARALSACWCAATALLIPPLLASPATAQLFRPPHALNTNAGSDTGWGDEYPQVTTDGAGSWVAVWHSDDSLRHTIGSDSDILVAIDWSVDIPALAPRGLAVAALLLTLAAGGWLGRRRRK